jgi:hypothetical protein
MKLDPHRPLAPQLDDAFDPKTHGTTVPDILREMARRIDALDNAKYNIARRFTLMDDALVEAGLRPSYQPPGLASGHEAPDPERSGDSP